MAEVVYSLPDSPPKRSSAKDTEMADLALRAVASRYSSSVVGGTETATGKSSFVTTPDHDWKRGLRPMSTGILVDSASLPLQLPQYPTTESTDADLPDLLTDQRLLFLSACEVDDFLDPLISRIGMLAQLAAEEEDQEAIRSDSFAGFLRFLYVHRPRIWRRPQLVLTPEGHLRAEWRETRDHRLAVRFLDENRVTFVSFAPDPHDPTQINRVGGSSSVYGFFETIPNESNATAHLFGEDIKTCDSD